MTIWLPRAKSCRPCLQARPNKKCCFLAILTFLQLSFALRKPAKMPDTVVFLASRRIDTYAADRYAFSPRSTNLKTWPDARSNDQTWWMTQVDYVAYQPLRQNKQKLLLHLRHGFDSIHSRAIGVNVLSWYDDATCNGAIHDDVIWPVRGSPASSCRIAFDSSRIARFIIDVEKQEEKIMIGSICTN